MREPARFWRLTSREAQRAGQPCSLPMRCHCSMQDCGAGCAARQGEGGLQVRREGTHEVVDVAAAGKGAPVLVGVFGRREVL